MKILIIVFTYLPEQNGVAFAAMGQKNILKKLGHEVTIFTSGKHDDIREQIYRFDISGSSRLFFSYKGQINSLFDAIEERSWDYIFIHAWHSWPVDLVIPFLKCKKRKEKIVLFSHCLAVNLFDPSSIKSWIRYFSWRYYYWFSVENILKKIDYIIFLDRSTINRRYIDYGIAKKHNSKMMFIPNINTYNSNCKHINTISMPSNEKILICSVGNFGSDKNQMDLLRVFIQLDSSKYHFILAGSHRNAYSKKLEKYIRNRKIHNIDLLYAPTRPDLNFLYNKMFLHVSLSRSECQSMVSIEVISAGKPFIALKQNETDFLSCGIYVNSKDKIVKEIETLVARPDVYSTICRKALLSSRRFSEFEVSKKYVELIDVLEAS